MSAGPAMPAIAADDAAIAERVRAQLYAAARDDLDIFCAVVLRDERDGSRLHLAPMHNAMLQLAQAHDRLVLVAHAESGKTALLAVGHLLWCLGRDPSLRCAVVSNAHSQSAKIVRTAAGYILRSPELHAVFPNLRPATPWTDSAFTVERPYISKDASLVAYGKHGAVIGSRLDAVVVDDADDWESVRTPEQRQALYDWFNSSVISRLTQNARVIVATTAWHPDDLAHRLARLPGWRPHRFAVVDDAGNSRWPERWPLARIEARRAELGEGEFTRQMMAQARDEGSAVIKREWIERALERGRGVQLLRSVGGGVHAGFRTYTGVDLAVQQHARADLTALVSIAQHPNGDVQVIGVEAGRWDALEIVRRICDTAARYCSTVVIENVSAQDYLKQILQARTSIPIIPHTTGRGKASLDFAIEQLAVRLGNGKVILPSGEGRPEPQVAALVRELLDYAPGSHVGDRLAAFCFGLHGLRHKGTAGWVSMPVSLSR